MAFLKFNNNFISHNGKLLNIPLNPKFTILIDTTKSGSASNTFILPTVGAGYNAVVEWGDGTSQTITGTPGNVTKVYSTPGTYEIKISGLFPSIYFNNGGDCAKLIEIKNWGSIVWGSMRGAFFGCYNMIASWKDNPNLSVATDISWMFFGCMSLNYAINFNTSHIIDCNRMFVNCITFNKPINIDTTNITNMTQMFGNCYVFDQDISNFNIESVTNMTGMFVGANNLSTTNYNLLLISWATQNVKSNVPFDAGDAQCSGVDAKTARLHLINTHGWTITDTPPV